MGRKSFFESLRKLADEMEPIPIKGKPDFVDVTLSRHVVKALKEVYDYEEDSSNASFIHRLLIEALIFRGMAESVRRFDAGREEALDIAFDEVGMYSDLGAFLGGSTKRDAFDIEVAIKTYVCFFNNKRYSEYNMYNNILPLIQKMFPKAVSQKVKVDPKHRPDAFVEINGERIPVEVKKGEFGEKAKGQLRRYMRRYGASWGIGIGRRIPAVSEPDMVFIKYEEE